MILNVYFVYIGNSDEISTANDQNGELEDNPEQLVNAEVTSKECIFCDKRIRRRNGANQKLTKATLIKRNRILQILRIQNLVEKFDQCTDSHDTYYHLACLAERDYKLLESSKKVAGAKENSNWSIRRDIHSATFSEIEEHVKATLVENKDIQSLQDIHNRYSAIFKEKKVQFDPQDYETKIEAICNTIIFSTTNGTVKPATCMQLGLVTKNMTGSRKMLEVLNRQGFSISYTVAEELETELAYSCSRENSILPYGLIPKTPQLRTHVPFDNYDQFVETATGKDTLHDTVGIVYQNVEAEAETEVSDPSFTQEDYTFEIDEECSSSTNPTRLRRRKYLSSFNSTIQPYSRSIRTLQLGQPFMANEIPNPKNLSIAFDLNNIWMLNHVYNTKGAKRWYGWNADRHNDENPLQKIGYLPNINASPTNDATIKKTLEIASQIGNECEQKYIIATYDLAIASKAYQNQMDLQPQFDHVFINLGSFHIQLSYFKVVLSGLLN